MYDTQHKRKTKLTFKKFKFNKKHLDNFVMRYCVSEGLSRITIFKCT